MAKHLLYKTHIVFKDNFSTGYSLFKILKANLINAAETVNNFRQNLSKLKDNKKILRDEYRKYPTLKLLCINGEIISMFIFYHLFMVQKVLEI